MRKDLLSIRDLSAEEIWRLFKLTKEIKDKQREHKKFIPLEGKTLAMIFEKPSLRTRVTFELGIRQLGGDAIYLAPQDIQLGKRESVADVARNLSRWVDCIMARTFSHQVVVELAQYATIPVINGLTELEHPCQALSDFYTIWEHKSQLTNLKLAFIGDGNNVCHSLLLLAAKLGVDISVACSEGYEPRDEIVRTAEQEAIRSNIEIYHTPEKAAEQSDIIYTDVWASMGQEHERAERIQKFKDFQVNERLLTFAKDDVLVMHCLPAHRGEEITDAVLDGPHSIVLDQAENRLHVQKAILLTLLK